MTKEQATPEPGDTVVLYNLKLLRCNGRTAVICKVLDGGDRFMVSTVSRDTKTAQTTTGTRLLVQKNQVAPTPSSPTAFVKDQRVVVYGLVKAMHYNGRIGVTKKALDENNNEETDTNKDGGRIQVKLAPSAQDRKSRIISVKPENMAVIAQLTTLEKQHLLRKKKDTNDSNGGVAQEPDDPGIAMNVTDENTTERNDKSKEELAAKLASMTKDEACYPEWVAEAMLEAAQSYLKDRDSTPTTAGKYVINELGGVVHVPPDTGVVANEQDIVYDYSLPLESDLFGESWRDERKEKDKILGDVIDKFNWSCKLLQRSEDDKFFGIFDAKKAVEEARDMFGILGLKGFYVKYLKSRLGPGAKFGNDNMGELHRNYALSYCQVRQDAWIPSAEFHELVNHEGLYYAGIWADRMAATQRPAFANGWGRWGFLPYIALETITMPISISEARRGYEYSGCMTVEGYRVGVDTLLEIWGAALLFDGDIGMSATKLVSLSSVMRAWQQAERHASALFHKLNILEIHARRLEKTMTVLEDLIASLNKLVETSEHAAKSIRRLARKLEVVQGRVAESYRGASVLKIGFKPTDDNPHAHTFFEDASEKLKLAPDVPPMTAKPKDGSCLLEQLCRYLLSEGFLEADIFDQADKAHAWLGSMGTSPLPIEEELQLLRNPGSVNYTMTEADTGISGKLVSPGAVIPVYGEWRVACINQASPLFTESGDDLSGQRIFMTIPRSKIELLEIQYLKKVVGVPHSIPSMKDLNDRQEFWATPFAARFSPDGRLENLVSARQCEEKRISTCMSPPPQVIIAVRRHQSRPVVEFCFLELDGEEVNTAVLHLLTTLKTVVTGFILPKCRRLLDLELRDGTLVELDMVQFVEDLRSLDPKFQWTGVDKFAEDGTIDDDMDDMYLEGVYNPKTHTWMNPEDDFVCTWR